MFLHATEPIAWRFATVRNRRIRKSKKAIAQWTAPPQVTGGAIEISELPKKWFVVHGQGVLPLLFRIAAKRNEEATSSLFSSSSETSQDCIRNSDYYPWDYCLSQRSIVLLAKQRDLQKNRHVQPPPGPERAFGDALREIRTEHDISQEQLALESGMDRTYVSLIERGVQSPTIRSIVKLADVLGVKPSEIILRMEALTAKTRSTRSK